MISPPRATPAASGGNVTFLRSGHQVDTQLPTVDSASSESEVADLFAAKFEAACSPWDLESTTADDHLLTERLDSTPCIKAQPVSVDQAFTAITSGLKSGKSTDHLGIASEHFLHAAHKLISPTRYALSAMVNLCLDYAADHLIRLNPEKTENMFTGNRL